MARITVPFLCLMAAAMGVGAASKGNALPPLAQKIDQRSFNVLQTVPPATDMDGLAQFTPPGTTMESLTDKPFHVYNDEFLSIIGDNPTLTLLNHTAKDPIFHEAAVWNPATDEMFFCQNSGSPDAGTGMAKSAVIEKIALSGITPAITAQRNASGSVKIEVVNSKVTVMNPNGGTNYKGKLLFLGEGQGASIAPAIYLMDPTPPYETKVILNNFFGRQFNSLNDASINPRNGEIYFTDPTYGYAQDFRPTPGMQKQVYRFNDDTGAVSVVADGFNMPNGIVFSHTGDHVYVTDSGMVQAFFGTNMTSPSSIYRFDVAKDGTLSNRKVFAFVTPGPPDGIHVDTKGNVYVGCGDAVQVFNPSGTLIGKIYLGRGVANFQFAGKGRMVILSETELWYATLAAEGAFPGRKY